MTPRKRKRLIRPRNFLAQPLRRLVKQAVKTAEPAGREICGLLVDNGTLLELVPMKNKSKAPGSFQLSWKKIKRAERAARRLGHRVVGTFHSHPASPAVPGPSDLEYACGDLMLIIACWDPDAKLWVIRKGKAEEVPYRTLEV